MNYLDNKNCTIYEEDVNVLIIEDNKINQIVITSLLEKLNLNVWASANGQEALKVLESQTFDIILVDLSMPGMNGFEVVSAIRQREKISKTYTPIIAITSYASEQIKIQCIRSGMDAYIPKPIELKTFYEILEMFLSKKNLGKL